MERAVLAFVLAAVPAGLFAQDSGAVATVPGVGAIRYAGAAVGFQIAFDVVEPADGAFDAAAVGDITFSLGRYGALCYKPSVGVWFTGSHMEMGNWYYMGQWVTSRESKFTEVHVNLADIAYYFPVPERVVVRPYSGMGLSLTIDHFWYEFGEWPDRDTEVNAGFNVMAGADFRFTPRLAALCEIRGKVSHGWNVFKLAAGMKFAVGAQRP